MGNENCICELQIMDHWSIYMKHVKYIGIAGL
jgi:hypothetical protein